MKKSIGFLLVMGMLGVESGVEAAESQAGIINVAQVEPALTVTDLQNANAGQPQDSQVTASLQNADNQRPFDVSNWLSGFFDNSLALANATALVASTQVGRQHTLPELSPEVTAKGIQALAEGNSPASPEPTQAQSTGAFGIFMITHSLTNTADLLTLGLNPKVVKEADEAIARVNTFNSAVESGFDAFKNGLDNNSWSYGHVAMGLINLPGKDSQAKEAWNVMAASKTSTYPYTKAPPVVFNTLSKGVVGSKMVFGAAVKLSINPAYQQALQGALVGLLSTPAGSKTLSEAPKDQVKQLVKSIVANKSLKDMKTKQEIVSTLMAEHLKTTSKSEIRKEFSDKEKAEIEGLLDKKVDNKKPSKVGLTGLFTHHILLANASKEDKEKLLNVVTKLENSDADATSLNKIKKIPLGNEILAITSKDIRVQKLFKGEAAAGKYPIEDKAVDGSRMQPEDAAQKIKSAPVVKAKN